MKNFLSVFFLIISTACSKSNDSDLQQIIVSNGKNEVSQDQVVYSGKYSLNGIAKNREGDRLGEDSQTVSITKLVSLDLFARVSEGSKVTIDESQALFLDRTSVDVGKRYVLFLCKKADGKKADFSFVVDMTDGKGSPDETVKALGDKDLTVKAKEILREQTGVIFSKK